MTTDHLEINVDEHVKIDGDRISEVEYECKAVNSNGDIRTFNIVVSRDAYNRIAATMYEKTLSFDQFTKVLKPFVMGSKASSDIPEAFRLLNIKNSGKVGPKELALFTHVVSPDITPTSLRNYISKVSTNNEYELNLTEFTELLTKGIGRDIAFGLA